MSAFAFDLQLRRGVKYILQVIYVALLLSFWRSSGIILSFISTEISVHDCFRPERCPECRPPSERQLNIRQSIEADIKKSRPNRTLSWFRFSDSPSILPLHQNIWLSSFFDIRTGQGAILKVVSIIILIVVLVAYILRENLSIHCNPRYK